MNERYDNRPRELRAEGLDRSVRKRRRRALGGAAAVLVIAVGSALVLTTQQRGGEQDVFVAAAPASSGDAATTTGSVAPFATSSTVAIPTATRPALVAPDVDTDQCPQFRPGPITQLTPFPSADGADEQSQVSDSRAQHIVEVLQNYAQANPEEFSFVDQVWDGSTATAVVAYSGNIDHHCAALQQLLADAARWEIRWNAYSAAELHQLESDITDEFAPLYSLTSRGVLTIELDPARRADADLLVARYSPEVRVVLGAHPYPDLATSTSTCPRYDFAEHRTSDLTIELASPTVLRSGSTALVDVLVTNPSDQTIWTVKPEEAFLSDTEQILSISAVHAHTAGERPPLILGPGETILVQLDVSTATCHPADGYQLPPGTYALEVALGDGWAFETVTITE